MAVVGTLSVGVGCESTDLLETDICTVDGCRNVVIR
jgi:hypothetical protein